MTRITQCPPWLAAVMGGLPERSAPREHTVRQGAVPIRNYASRARACVIRGGAPATRASSTSRGPYRLLLPQPQPLPTLRPHLHRDKARYPPPNDANMSQLQSVDPVIPNHSAPSPVKPELPQPDLHDEPFLVRKRIAILGARGVGKSAISIQCALNRFEPDYMPTFEDTYQWTPVVDGVHYDVRIVDTDGQDENSFFGLQYTIGIDAYILMFSVRDESSFEVIKAVNDKLLDTLNVVTPFGTSEVPRVLVGNQIDITHERQVSKSAAIQYAEQQGIPYFETSAYTAHNVTHVFTHLLRIIEQNLRNSHTSQAPERQSDAQPPGQETDRKNFCFVQ